jgi:hypothetical protein
MRRQIVKEPYLVAHIQVLDCLADFLDRAHEKNLTQIFPMRRELRQRSQGRRKNHARQKEEGRIKAADAAMFATANPSYGESEVGEPRMSDVRRQISDTRV